MPMRARPAVALIVLAAGLLYQLSLPAAAGQTVDARAIQILKAEDERRYDDHVARLLRDTDPRMRERAALAAGRIGDPAAASELLRLLESDADARVRETAAFALGLIASPSANAGLLKALASDPAAGVRGRAVEALGRIAAALPREQDTTRQELGRAILKTLTEQAQAGGKQERNVVLLGLTGALRARPAEAAPAIAPFLTNPDARVRADAANALARLRAKGAGETLRRLLADDTDPIVRANAARALGAAEDADAGSVLVQRAVSDPDSRVRVSAIRSLAQIKFAAASGPLLERMEALLPTYLTAKAKRQAQPAESMELFDLAATLGRVLSNSANERAIRVLSRLREAERMAAPELEIAFARIAPASYVQSLAAYFRKPPHRTAAVFIADWRWDSSAAQALGVLPEVLKGPATDSAAGKILDEAGCILHSMIEETAVPPLAVPDILRALKTVGRESSDALGDLLREQVIAEDVVVRETAVELLGALPATAPNTYTLTSLLALEKSEAVTAAKVPLPLWNGPLALAIIEALGKHKNEQANAAIRSALDWPDHLVRRKAVAVLAANNAGDYSQKIGTVQTRNTEADYRRALVRRNGQVRASVLTEKGTFVIELLPEEAPLTVENFIRLAERRFFSAIPFHRVVPNFVIQGGDPRGDGNGGPGYEIRCEINRVPYERGAVGMALSGKDTGGSQWFVTHSPQPHLDGGYTVFGRTISGMDVVDRITRWDRIVSVSITEGRRPR